MKTKRSIFVLIMVMFCVVLTAVSALAMTGCGKKSIALGELENPVKKGTGSKTFDFVVVNKAGEKKYFKISTDAETVGAALVADGVKLISGDETAYGLYVKVVDGEKLDYETDGYYWAFYVSDDATLESKDYAMLGVDSTPIEEGKIYALVAEKAEY